MKAQTFLLAVAMFGCQITLAAEFHVAPTGNDANPGTKAKPFATLERARETVRALQTREGATVCIAPALISSKNRWSSRRRIRARKIVR